MPSETLYAGRYLRLVHDETWEYVERIRSSGVAVILPLTADGRIILVEQFRHAVGKKVIALPAGLAGDHGAGEEILVAAQRELFEETGYASARWTLLATGPSSPGLTSEMITFYLAAAAARRGAPTGAAEEGITVHEILLSDLSGWLAAREGEGTLIDYKIFAALHLRAHLPA
jgi:ADP-ribose pyrophosphatase